MNIFLPYENDIQESIKALDDYTLNNQIIECYELLKSAIVDKMDGEVGETKSNPYFLHYKNDLKFLYDYGVSACAEYALRFHKNHNCDIRFYYLINCYGDLFKDYVIKPFYSDNKIETTKNVGILFRQKLIKEWQKNKMRSQWTNREIPRFYKEFLDKIC